MEQQLHLMIPWLIPTIIILAIWDAVWKLIAMWKAARNNHLAWFICIAIFNTILLHEFKTTGQVKIL